MVTDKTISLPALLTEHYLSLEISMNKFLATLLVGAFALTLGSSAFAADAAKPAEPVKTEATVVTPASDTKAAPTKASKKHHHKHAKKAVETTATTDAKEGLTGK